MNNGALSICKLTSMPMLRGCNAPCWNSDICLPPIFQPSMVFHEVERLDGIRMVRLLVPPDLGPIRLIPLAKPIVELIMRRFIERQVPPRIAKAIPNISLFKGLTQEQSTLLASQCTLRTYEQGEQIFAQNQKGEEAFIILEGDVEICMGDPSSRVGSIGSGECLGEISLLADTPHSATASAQTIVETAVLNHQAITELTRLRPDIGLIIYRNLAQGLGHKLKRSDER